MLGVSGRWVSRVHRTGNDHMGRWSWIDLREKQGKMIRIISAYRVSHASYKTARETTSCRQQERSMLGRGLKNPNPKKGFLTDISNMMKGWRGMENILKSYLWQI